MKALIIAAGRGSRFKGVIRNKSKPLIQLLGLSLIERVILTAKDAGIDEFVIVVGFRGDKVKEKLGNGAKYGVKITYVENKEWEKENGVSVLKAKDVLKEEEDFILLMSDHIFDLSILKGLLKYVKVKKNECVLCVDKLENVFDLEDTTKVLMEKNTLKAIGKGIKNYNAIDCGVFYYTPVIFNALEKAVAKGKYTLSDGVRYLIKWGKIRGFDIGGKFWGDIDTPESLEYAKGKMLNSLEKPTDGIISKHINRRISRQITARIVNTNLTPTQITVISFLTALVSAAFFFLGGYKYLIIGGILVQLASIIDGCDGEVARLKFLTTDYGAFVDSILDRYADAIIILGLIFGYWILKKDISVWIIGFFTILGSFMISYTNARHENVFENPINGKRGIPIRRDMRLFLIMIGAFLNQVLILLLILAIFTNIEVVRRLWKFSH